MASGGSSKAMFGSEFTELEDPKDPVTRRPLRPEEQVVTDDRGRRRFHGAFTGGFSAGYFLSVGSKEGWTPKAFKSSRTARAEEDDDAPRRPEDFMDADDLGEHGIAPRSIRTAADFAEKRREAPTTERLAWERPADATPAAKTLQLRDIIQPVSDSFGVKLLISMGWRAGKGIGAKVRRKKRERSPGEKAARAEQANIGCQLPPGLVGAPGPGDVSDSSSSSSLSDVDLPGGGRELLLDPEDIDPHIFQPKKDSHGLGYSGLDKGPGPARPVSTGVRGARGRGIRGEAFGVGAFEEEDEDIYSQVTTDSYDFSIGGVEKPQKPTHQSDAFHVAKEALPPRTFFHRPKLPRDFQPRHKVLKLCADEALVSLAKDKKVRMNPVMRAAMMGESYSVASLVPSDRRREEEKKEKKPKERKSRWGERPPKEEPKEEETFIDEDVKPADLLVFPQEPIRQARFMQFLNCVKRGWAMPQPVELSEAEWNSEKAELADALPPGLRRSHAANSVNANTRPLARAEVAAPFAHLLANKFTRSTNATTTDPTIPERGSDAMEAVKMKMFGKLTREKFKWHPAYAVCKRFNLPNPYPDSGLEGVPELQAQKTVAQRDRMDSVLGKSALPSTAQELANRRRMSPPRRSRKEETSSSDSSDSGEDENAEPTEDPAAENSRPAPDLFKAIFDDQESGEEDEDEEATPPPTVKALPQPFHAVAEPPEMRAWEPPPLPEPSRPALPPVIELGSSPPRQPASRASESSYGPSLPPSMPVASAFSPPSSSKNSRRRRHSSSPEPRSPSQQRRPKKIKKEKKAKKEKKEKKVKKEKKDKKVTVFRGGKKKSKKRKSDRKDDSDGDSSSDSDIQIL